MNDAHDSPFANVGLADAQAASIAQAAGTASPLRTPIATWEINRAPQTRQVYPTAAQLMALSDGELERVDPIVMNLVVVKDVPECADLDISRYVATVDHWAAEIEKKNIRDERVGSGRELLEMDRDRWLAGGMAVMLASTYGIKYTTEKLDPAQPHQHFVHGVIDKRLGTCASMPVLYTGIGHRLGWPIKEVVALDHCWARWDDGIPREKGGKRFNIEATSVCMPGHEGQFCMPEDEHYIADIKVPPIAVQSGSDMTSLTAREVLGVHLQARAAYWHCKGNHQRAEADLLLATACFPKNRNIRMLLFASMSRNNLARFTEKELQHLAGVVATGARPVQFNTDYRPRPQRQGPVALDIESINRENARRMEEMLRPPTPGHVPGVPPGMYRPAPIASPWSNP